jgi:hypothetical protein
MVKNNDGTISSLVIKDKTTPNLEHIKATINNGFKPDMIIKKKLNL